MTIKLTLTKLIRAERNKVFAAWITPETMNLWFCPPGLTLTDSGCDPRVGGEFHATMEGHGQKHSVRGVYREITPGRKLVFTHRWDQPQAVETLVTVEFVDRDGGTELTLTHDRLRNEESKQGHIQGWQGTLEKLAAHFG